MGDVEVELSSGRDHEAVAGLIATSDPSCRMVVAIVLGYDMVVLLGPYSPAVLADPRAGPAIGVRVTRPRPEPRHPRQLADETADLTYSRQRRKRKARTLGVEAGLDKKRSRGEQPVIDAELELDAAVRKVKVGGRRAPIRFRG